MNLRKDFESDLTLCAFEFYCSFCCKNCNFPSQINSHLRPKVPRAWKLKFFGEFGALITQPHLPKKIELHQR